MKKIYAIIIIGLLLSMSLYAEQFGIISIPKPEVQKQAVIPAMNSVNGFELIYSNLASIPATRNTQPLTLNTQKNGVFSMYATLDDFKQRLKDHYEAIYSDDEGVIDESAMTDDLTTVYGVVNAYIAKRYQTPVTQADALPMLRACQLALASELAWLRPDNNELPEKIKDAAKTARGQLEDIKDGDLTLPATPLENASAAGASVIVSGDKPVFGRSNMGGF